MAILTLSVAVPAQIDGPDPPYLDGSSADVQCVLFEVVDRSGGSASP